MADDDDDGTRRPPQAYDTVAPAGVGTTTTNQVSPGTMQEIYFTGDQSIIDQAMDEMGVDDLDAFLQQLPSPNTVARTVPLAASSRAGVGSQASRTPSTDGAHTPLGWGSARLSSGARTPVSHVSVPLAAAGAGGDGGGGDDGSGGSGGSRRSTPRGRPDRLGRGRGRGRPRRRPIQAPRLPWTRPDPSTLPSPRGSWSYGSQPRTLGQGDLQRRLRMMLQDQKQLAQGRDIANVTMTNSIVTSYKQGGPPTVQSSSSWLST